MLNDKHIRIIPYNLNGIHKSFKKLSYLIFILIIILNNVNTIKAEYRPKWPVPSLQRELFFLSLEDGYFGCQLNDSTNILQIFEISKLCDGKPDCFKGSDELSAELKCSDRNQCHPQEPKCTNGVCLDNLCYCNDGFGGKGCSLPDENECKYRPCDVFAHCTNTLGSFYCSCMPGYDGDGFTCHDVNECEDPNLSSYCVENAECCNLPGHFVCKCKSGFEGNGTSSCTDIDECKIQGSCGKGALCINKLGSYECNCPVGYTGDPMTECWDIDECKNKPCNNGTCHNLPGAYSCTCLPGYKANSTPEEGCIDINECENKNSCGKNSICLNTEGAYFCQCPPGYTGDPRIGCSDIDECSTVTSCGANAICSNNLGSFTCQCKEGFSGDPYLSAGCLDINECSLANVCAPENSDCINLQGSFECKCKQGTTGDPIRSCIDINECESNPCGPNAMCINLERDGYQCKCPDKFIPRGTPEYGCDKAECETDDNCVGNARCLNSLCYCPPPYIQSDNDCVCPPGYINDVYAGCLSRETKISYAECTDKIPCPAGTICYRGTCSRKDSCSTNRDCLNDSTCKLVNENVGKQCVDPCDHIQCGPNSFCSTLNHQPACHCNTSYSGNPNDLIFGCSPKGPPPFMKYCDSDLDCDQKSVCKPNFAGPKICLDVCDDTRCGPNAFCRSVNKKAECYCAKHFQGNPYDLGKGCSLPASAHLCQTDDDCSAEKSCILTLEGVRNCVDVCKHHQCTEGSKCVVRDHRPLCECLPGLVRVSSPGPNGTIFGTCEAHICENDNECKHDEHCIVNYRGLLDCAPVCAEMICGENAECISIAHQAKCVCKKNYEGNAMDLIKGCQPIAYTCENCKTREPRDCISSPDCGDAQECVAGQCKFLCNKDSECIVGERCLDNFCVPLNTRITMNIPTRNQPYYDNRENYVTPSIPPIPDQKIVQPNLEPSTFPNLKTHIDDQLTFGKPIKPSKPTIKEDDNEFNNQLPPKVDIHKQPTQPQQPSFDHSLDNNRNKQQPELNRPENVFTKPSEDSHPPLETDEKIRNQQPNIKNDLNKQNIPIYEEEKQREQPSVSEKPSMASHMSDTDTYEEDVHKNSMKPEYKPPSSKDKISPIDHDADSIYNPPEYKPIKPDISKPQVPQNNVMPEYKHPLQPTDNIQPNIDEHHTYPNVKQPTINDRKPLPDSEDEIGQDFPMIFDDTKKQRRPNMTVSDLSHQFPDIDRQQPPRPDLLHPHLNKPSKTEQPSLINNQIPPFKTQKQPSYQDVMKPNIGKPDVTRPGFNRPNTNIRQPDQKQPYRPDYDLPDTNLPDQKQPDQRYPDQRYPDQKQPSRPDYNLPDINLPDQKYPDQKQPDQKYPDQKQPDQRYPDTNLPDQRYPDQKQPDQKYPDTNLPDQRYPDQRYPVQKQPDQRYPDQRYPDQKQPDQRYPDQKQPDQRYPDQKQPDQKYPDQRYPDQKQPDQKYPDQKQQDQRYPDQKQPSRQDQKATRVTTESPSIRPTKPTEYSPTEGKEPIDNEDYIPSDHPSSSKPLNEFDYDNNKFKDINKVKPPQTVPDDSKYIDNSKPNIKTDFPSKQYQTPIRPELKWPTDQKQHVPTRITTVEPDYRQQPTSPSVKQPLKPVYTDSESRQPSTTPESNRIDQNKPSKTDQQPKYPAVSSKPDITKPNTYLPPIQPGILDSTSKQHSMQPTSSKPDWNNKVQDTKDKYHNAEDLTTSKPTSKQTTRPSTISSKKYTRPTQFMDTVTSRPTAFTTKPLEKQTSKPTIDRNQTTKPSISNTFTEVRHPPTTSPTDTRLPNKQQEDKNKLQQPTNDYKPELREPEDEYDNKFTSSRPSIGVSKQPSITQKPSSLDTRKPITGQKQTNIKTDNRQQTQQPVLDDRTKIDNNKIPPFADFTPTSKPEIRKTTQPDQIRVTVVKHSSKQDFTGRPNIKTQHPSVSPPTLPPHFRPHPDVNTPSTKDSQSPAIGGEKCVNNFCVPSYDEGMMQGVIVKNKTTGDISGSKVPSSSTGSQTPFRQPPIATVVNTTTEESSNSRPIHSDSNQPLNPPTTSVVKQPSIDQHGNLDPNTIKIRICVDGVCHDKMKGCSEDNDCPSDRTCDLQSRQCISPCFQCGPNSECSATGHKAVCECPKGTIGDSFDKEVGCFVPPEATDPSTERTIPPVTNIQVQCQSDGIQTGVKLGGYDGIIYVKGYSQEYECRRTVRNDEREVIDFKVHFGQCGLFHANGEASFILIVQKHPKLVTYRARAYLVKCLYNTGERVISLGFNVSMISTSGTIANTGPPPTCSLSICTLDGNEVSSAEIGDDLLLKIDYIYSGFARSCIAKTMEEEGEYEYKVTDDDGCATDPTIFGNWEYDESKKSLVARFNAFKFPSSNNLRFQCNIRICFNNCPPANCGDTQAYGRRRRKRSEMDDTENDQSLTLTNSLGLDTFKEGQLREEIQVQSNAILTFDKHEQPLEPFGQQRSEELDHVCLPKLSLVLSMIITTLLSIVCIAVAISCWLMAYRRKSNLTHPLAHPSQIPNPLFATPEPIGSTLPIEPIPDYYH